MPKINPPSLLDRVRDAVEQLRREIQRALQPRVLNPQPIPVRQPSRHPHARRPRR